MYKVWIFKFRIFQRLVKILKIKIKNYICINLFVKEVFFYKRKNLDRNIKDRKLK